MSVKVCRVALAGFGNVGKAFVRLVAQRERYLAAEHGIELRFAGVAELGAALIRPEGVSAAELAEFASGNRSLCAHPSGAKAVSALEMLEAADGELAIDAMTTNLDHGEPGLGFVRAALRRGMDVVLADKGPVALAFAELAELADTGPVPVGNRPMLRMDACVGGALPTLAVAMRDLASCRIERIELALNGTSQSILRRMEAGDSLAEALLLAQEQGIAEQDPRLDIGGWDLAAKLCVFANVVLRQPTAIGEIAVAGIDGLTTSEVRAACTRAGRVVLLGEAVLTDGRYRLRVAPRELATGHPLAAMDAYDMGVVFYSDWVPRLVITSLEPTAAPAAAALLRNVLDILGVRKLRGM